MEGKIRGYILNNPHAINTSCQLFWETRRVYYIHGYVRVQIRGARRNRETGKMQVLFTGHEGPRRFRIWHTLGQHDLIWYEEIIK